MAQNVEDLTSAQEPKVVIIAEDEGDFFCLTDSGGTPQLFLPGDPVIPELIEEARTRYGADARTVSIEEFEALADDAG